MVPALLYLLFKKLRKQDWSKIKRNCFSRLSSRANHILLILLTSFLALSLVLPAQQQILNYKVVRKGKEIGWAHIQKTVDSNGTLIAFASEIKASFILTFSSSAREISEFKDGTLRHSYFYRKVNGSIKADRHT